MANEWQETEVDIVRTFEATGMELGVADDEDGRFFVYDRERGRTCWHRHCGPYSTWQQAADWINAICESK